VHEYDAELLARRQVGQQVRDNLDGLAARARHPRGVAMQLRRLLVLEVHARIVLVGGALTVDEHLEPRLRHKFDSVSSNIKYLTKARY